MYILIPLFFQLSESHKWQDRNLDNPVLRHAPHPVKHSQGFYKDGTSSGYFRDGQFRRDIGHTEQEYKKARGPFRVDSIMKQAEKNVQQTWSEKKYNPIFHNCRQYKKAVNEEYNRLAGLGLQQPKVNK